MPSRRRADRAVGTGVIAPPRAGHPTGHWAALLARVTATGERRRLLDCEMTRELAWFGARMADAHDGRDSCFPL